MDRVCLTFKKKTRKTVFQSGCIILQSHQQCMSVPVAPYPHEHLVLSAFQFSHSFFGCPLANGVTGPGTRSSLSCGLSCSCGNDRSLTYCAGPRTEPVSRSSHDATDPTVPQHRELLVVFFALFLLGGYLTSNTLLGIFHQFMGILDHSLSLQTLP